MAMRWIEIVAPKEHLDAVRKKVGNAEVHDWWTLEHPERSVVRVVLEGKHVEDLLEALEPLCDGDDGGKGPVVRAVVGNVDAMLPKPVKDENGEVEETKGKGKDEDSDRVSRFELVERVERDARFNRQYVFMVVLSSIVAAIGLVRGNVAVVVGAMVIAPLLAPNMALALAATLADWRMAWTAVKTGMSGVAIAMVLGVALGWMLPVDSTVPEIASRTSVDELDLLLALAAGAAGALAITSGVSGALVGVMVAVALLPPLLVIALLAGAGEWRGASGAMLLYSVNVASVNLAGITVFLARGITPRTWWEKRRAQRAAWWGMGFWVGALVLLVVGLVVYNRG
ncbi:TIGR00341 family protein [Halomonas denitrificans]|nr:TIGR00341 family protein [Halomonas denitrificans]